MKVSETAWMAMFFYLHTLRGISSMKSEDAYIERNIELENKTRELFENLLDGYDRKIRPFFGTGHPVNVTVDIYLASFDNIHEELMEYGVTIYLRQRWCDPRLRHSESIPLPPTSHYVSHLWLPDLIISNAKIAKFKDVTFLNQVVDINKNGDVLYVSRLGLQLSCSMDFHRFPLDDQRCEIEMESFEYTIDDLVYMWDTAMPVEYHKNHLKLPQYEMKGGNVHNCTRRLRTGEYSCIGIKLVFGRKIGYYILQTYIPSILMVVMSWVSFWIEIKESPARVVLGVTTVLTMIATTNGVRQNLPPVSYVKAIDVWFSACLMFVIFALLEFALVHYLVGHKLNLNVKGRLNSLKRKQTKDVIQTSSQNIQQKESGDEKSCVTLTIEERPINERRALNGTAKDTNHGIVMVEKKTEPDQDEVIEGHGAYVNHAHFEMNTVGDHSERQVTVNGEPLDPVSRVMHVRGNCNLRAMKQPYLDSGRKIDQICRWAFPLAFAIFNFGYWIGYAQEIDPVQYAPGVEKGNSNSNQAQFSTGQIRTNRSPYFIQGPST